MDKPVHKSKTIWVAVANAAAVFIPGAEGFISENPESYMAIMSFIMVFMRWITGQGFQ